MATTTNYGWSTPDDTSLVKDGAAAIRTLGSSVDTTTKALNPSTTLGDVEYRSATANTNTRLPIGTSGQVLTVASGVPAWQSISAGGMTLLSTTTLSGTSTTISSISQDYNSLFFIVSQTDAASSYIIQCLPNNSSTTSFAAGVDGNTATSYTSSTIRLSGNQASIPSSPTAIKSFACRIDNYTNSTTVKPIQHYGHSQGNQLRLNFAGGIQLSAAITSLVFNFDGTTMTAGTVLLYGVK